MTLTRPLLTGAALMLALSACSRHGADANSTTPGAASSTTTDAPSQHTAADGAQATASRSLSLNLAGTWQPVSHAYMSAGELRIGAGTLQWKPCGTRTFKVAASSSQGATLRLAGMCSLGDQNQSRFNVIRLQPKPNGCDAELTLLGPDAKGQGTQLLARGLYSRKGCKASSNTNPSSNGDAGEDTSGPSSHLQHFEDAKLALSLDYPAGFTLKHGFSHQYLLGTDWKVYADKQSHGTPQLALVLDGSNKITAAQLRIGTSTDATALKQCLTPPSAASKDPQGYVNINGTPFYSFRAGDAGMSHYVTTRSYRVVQNGRCYAVDLIVSGTNPKVYNPPAKPPFSHEQAFAKLEQALHGLHLKPSAD
ncbi:hypothetical protein [Oleiagrimonas sp. C23AA]|uniref:hypothetical protein n=1 Tax=Oleiagrimonas sp. C23AA TaxID=2719047 RepID=UPI001421576C|nr:hypothetical protein [Oleiagrimonas sp. C23AA]NII09248.1 hypothetical protein [Oleiagrimonas sp. C23AA]